MREEIFSFKTKLIEEYNRERNKLEDEAEQQIECLKDENAEKLDKTRIQMDISDGNLNNFSIKEA